jgi:hypothetical protein
MTAALIGWCVTCFAAGLFVRVLDRVLERG